MTSILLAAGLSHRMGDQNKLLLPFLKKPIICHTLENLITSEIPEIIIVTGHEEEKLRFALDGYKVKFVHNPDYKMGMTSSIQAGIRASHDKTGGWMICQGDMLHILPHEYGMLFRAFEQSSHSKKPVILKPFFQSKGGNPVIFSRHFKQQLLEHKEAEGCKGLVQSNAKFIKKINMPTDNILKDLDTPSAYMQLLKSA